MKKHNKPKPGIAECELLAVAVRRCVAQQPPQDDQDQDEGLGEGEGECDLRRWTGRFLTRLQARYYCFVWFCVLWLVGVLLVFFVCVSVCIYMCICICIYLFFPLSLSHLRTSNNTPNTDHGRGRGADPHAHHHHHPTPTASAPHPAAARGAGAVRGDGGGVDREGGSGGYERWVGVGMCLRFMCV